MSKLYLNKQDIPKHEGLSEKLLNTIELGIPQNERQQIFRSLYDIEITGIVIYYKKNWRFDGQSREELESLQDKLELVEALQSD